ncbi:MAG: hypothetical protein FWG97_05545, partial [Deltaproteobacteria bacterium]|nr:hypothetical protein [Deltaproteobacteria bacterium]
PGPEHATAHGRDHIARSYVFASVFCGLLEEQAVKLDRNAVLLGVGGHKLGQWELGESKWADDSGKLLVKALRAKFGDDSMGQDYENALKGCLTKGGRSLEAMLIDQAGKLDSGRMENFELGQFDFMKEGSGYAPIMQMREQLLKEADLLQRRTDPYSMLRSSLSNLDRKLNEATDPEIKKELTFQKKEIMLKMAGLYRERRTETGEEVMGRIETAIRNYPQDFKLLTKYYLPK